MRRHCPECQTVYDDLRCYILCPHEKRGQAVPAKCRYCSTPAVAECSWPDERFIAARYAELKVGDRVKRAIERLQGRPPATVRHIALWFQDARDTIPSGLQVVLQIGKREKEVIVRGSSPVMVLRPHRCGNAVCEAHVREVGDHTRYCVEHWGAWQTVEVGAVGTGVNL